MHNYILSICRKYLLKVLKNEFELILFMRG